MIKQWLGWLLPPLVVGIVAIMIWQNRDRIFVSPQNPEDDHAEHSDHGASEDVIEVSNQARENLELRTASIELTDYWRSLSVPGIVIERPGHSDHAVTASVAGVILRVHVYPGQAIKPGQKLFDVQPTGEALATTQSNMLNTIEELEVVNAELDRVRPLVTNNVLPEKNQIELEYQQRKLKAALKVQKQELLVRGLTEEQVEAIVENQQLVKQVAVFVPDDRHTEPPFQPVSTTSADTSHDASIVYTVEQLDVHPGKLVERGAPLCHLARHSTLYIQGQAFEKEGELVASAAHNSEPITAYFEVGASAPLVRENLEILYVDNVVDPANRTFHFYIPLKNEVAHDSKQGDGRLYRSWRFKPGQKTRLKIPVQQWKEQIVLPSHAVVREGPETYVFISNGKLFARRAVHVQYEDGDSVVIANDGSVFPGEVVALNNAYQLNLALKKASGDGGGGGHHGHNH